MTERLTLDYHVPKGPLAPFFEALRQGQALAARCDGCGCVHFPPGPACPRCGTSRFEWIWLTGTARLLHRTDAPDATFALVRFEGADTAALVRLTGTQGSAELGRLVASAGEAPGLTLALVATREEDRDV